MRRALLIATCLAGGLLAAPQRGAADIVSGTGIIAHWSFNTDFSDVSGHGHDGVNSNTDGNLYGGVGNTLAVTTADSTFGGGCLTSGDDWNCVIFPAINLHSSPGYTISAWIKNGRNRKNGDAVFIGNEAASNSYLAYDSSYGGLRVLTTGYTNDFGLGLTTEDAGVWHHIVVTVDPVAGVKAYEDGVQKYSGTNGQNHQNNMVVSAIAGGYSTHNAGPTSSSNMDWYGLIDEVWLCNGVASQAQVLELMTYNSLPEPATLALLGLGALSLRRRRRKTA
jgi:hypothetical protein